MGDFKADMWFSSFSIFKAVEKKSNLMAMAIMEIILQPTSWNLTQTRRSQQTFIQEFQLFKFKLACL